MNTVRLSYPHVANLMQKLGMINEYQNKWLNANVIVELLHYHFNTPSAGTTAEYINRMYSNDTYNYINNTRQSNQYKLYRHRHDIKSCPYNTNKFWYYFGSNEATPSPFNCYSTSIIKTVQEIIRPNTRSTTATLNAPSTLPTVSPVTPDVTRKRKFDANVSINDDSRNAVNNQTKNDDNEDEDMANMTKQSSAIPHINALDAPESRWVFGKKDDRKGQNDQISTREMMIIQIQKLRKAWLKADGWRCVIDDGDSNNNMTSLDIFNVQTKSKYLSIFLSLCLDKYNRNLDELAQEAVHKVSEFEKDENDEDKDINHTYNYKTLLRWYRVFKLEHCFPNPFFTRNSRKGLPPIFCNNPEFKDDFVQYGRANIDVLSTEMMHQFCHNVALPALLEERKKELKEEDRENFTLEHLLRENGLQILSVPTIHRWMKIVGFEYKPRKKSYYVDNHERPDIVLHRLLFCRQYLSEIEIRCYRWIAFDEEDMLDLEERGVAKKEDASYVLEQEDSKYLYEYHIDHHETFLDHPNVVSPWGGNLSLRFPSGAKPIIVFGQDECIFKQYAMQNYSWVAPDGTKALVPKDDGNGVMISAFVSREFGYGYELTAHCLQLINESRRRQKYINEESAINKNGSNMKRQLLTSPFVRQLEYGANKEGYWDFDCMALQLEDCIDCMKVIHPNLEFVFLLDHSNGHDKIRPDGLNAKKVRKNYGGKQPKMRESTMKDETYFGIYDRILNVGDIQQMVYRENDIGPFYLSLEERQASKYDVVTNEVTTPYLSKKELIEQLKRKNISDPKGNTKQLREKCNELDLPIRKNEYKVIEGWVGKAKGALQILWERGFIDATCVHKYTNKGSLNGGVRDDSTSLECLMSRLPDFVNEETVLQQTGKKLGVTILRTPKCHPELAGEGIEYAWGVAKLFYRRQPLSMKRSKDSFLELVKTATSRTGVLNVRNIRRFSARARRYMIAYLAIYKKEQEHQQDKVTITHDIIEKCVKHFKTHRSAMDFDSAFIKSVIEEMLSFK